MNGWDAVVSDTGPLISLEKLPEGFQWVHSRLEHLFLPPAVVEEVAVPYEGKERFFQQTGLQDLAVVRAPAKKPKGLEERGWKLLEGRAASYSSLSGVGYSSFD